ATRTGQAHQPPQRRPKHETTQRRGWRGRVAATFGAGRGAREGRPHGRTSKPTPQSGAQGAGPDTRSKTRLRHPRRVTRISNALNTQPCVTRTSNATNTGLRHNQSVSQKNQRATYPVRARNKTTRPVTRSASLELIPRQKNAAYSTVFNTSPIVWKIC